MLLGKSQTGERAEVAVSVARVIASTLAANGTDRLFCVPGESYLALLDAFYDWPQIDVVTCRHEAGAGFMAVADARLTGRPGVVCVSRGPGASNAAIAVHTAQQDGVPLVLIIGHVALADIGRGAFQEIDYERMFGGIAKWVCSLTEPNDVAESLTKAWRISTEGVPGPVVVAVPEDLLNATTNRSTIAARPAVPAAPRPSSVDQFRQWLASAERPLAIAGGGLEQKGGREALLAFIEDWDLPLAVSFRRHDLIPNDHPNFVGDLGLSNPTSQMDAFQQSDLILALGTRLGDITTQGYTFPETAGASRRLVHVHAEAAVLGSQFKTDLSIACSPLELLTALGNPSRRPKSRAAWIEQLRLARRSVGGGIPADEADGVPFVHVVEAVARVLPRDAIVTVDAGTFATSIYRLIDFRPPQRLLAPISGAMGFGIPAAVAAALRHPDRPIVCFVGDGGLLMTCGELAAVAERGLPFKLIVSENRSYGSIRIHQECDYPGRVIGTNLHNPDIESLGRAFGFAVTQVNSVADFDRMTAALRAPGPQLINVKTSLLATLPRPAEACSHMENQ